MALANLSPSLYAQLVKQSHALPTLAPTHPNLFGLPLYTNSMFPYRQSCTKCAGTGDGADEATYCRSCIGAGEKIIEGVILDDRGMTVITGRQLPPRFAVSFPTIPVPAAPMRGRIYAIEEPKQ